MTQVKIFDDEYPGLEISMNEFLNENKGKIKVCDIKFSSCSNDRVVKKSAMVIYETIE